MRGEIIAIVGMGTSDVLSHLLTHWENTFEPTTPAEQALKEQVASEARELLEAYQRIDGVLSQVGLRVEESAVGFVGESNNLDSQDDLKNSVIDTVKTLTEEGLIRPNDKEQKTEFRKFLERKWKNRARG